MNINFTFDGKLLKAKNGDTILKAALENDIYIPHLCHHPDLPDIGACNLCVVKIEGEGVICNSCMTIVRDGMLINSHDEELDKIRKASMELLLANHIDDCTDCPKYLKCEFQSLIQYIGAGTSRVKNSFRSKQVNLINPLIIRDMSRCVGCGRCVRVCGQVRGVAALTYYHDSENRISVGPAGNSNLAESDCRFCGSCVEVCPTGALRDKEGVFKEPFARGEALIPCKQECPAQIDIPRYVRFCKENNYQEALAVVREKVPFPESLGNICSHICEDKCRRSQINEAVSIRELKRLAAVNGGDAWKTRLVTAADSGKKIAIVGGGPAGLTAAWFLRLKGHQVDVFEREKEAGGMLRYGIPEYRLSRQVVRDEIKEIESIGVRIFTDYLVNEKELEDYDAVIWAIGTGKGMKLPIEGCDAKGTVINLDLLKAVRNDEKVVLDGDVLVLGGGNVAFDCARTAVRLGAKKVSLACLESRESMTADEEEISEGLQEGITIYNSQTFHRVITEADKVTGVECSNVKSFCFDKNKKLVLELEENSKHVISCDTVIFAIGQKGDVPEFVKFELTPRGSISAGEDGQTTQKGVFAAGDIVTGTATVIKAIANAKKVAQTVDRYLGGNGEIEQVLSIEQNIDSWIGKEKGFAEKHRIACDSAECGLQEADRCLQCDLRAKLTRPRFQMEYGR